MIASIAEYVAGQIVAWLVVGAVSGVVSACVMMYILRARVREIDRQVQGLWGRTDKHRDDLMRIERDRLHCEAKAGQTYSTHAGLGRVLADQAQLGRDMLDRLDTMHGRINELAQQVARMNGEGSVRT